MQQVLFTIPILNGVTIGPVTFPAEGIPVYGFGAMLFITFIVCTIWGMRRGKRVGMPPERFQDMVIWIFISGIIGARVLYMIQYSHQFPNRSIGDQIGSFFRIWEGGIIFYGSALGGTLGYAIFYWFVLRKIPVNKWQLADAVAPILALGLAIGRIGCYLNGCCWGQVAIEEAHTVPLGGAHFPLLPAHARDQLVSQQALQTSTGFTIVPRDRSVPGADPRTVVLALEPGSPAEKAGVQSGDRIVKVNGHPNEMIVEVLGQQSDAAVKVLEGHGGRIDPGAPAREGKPAVPPRAFFENYEEFVAAVLAARKEAPSGTLIETDYFSERIRDWPRGKHELELAVLRDGNEVELPAFVPRTIALYPTQLYETVSMVLLIFLLVAYYPYRRHDGQLLVLCMLGYAVHRFINESIRIEPTVGFGLTLSQWGSVVIFAIAVGMEIYLRQVMPSRWAKGYQEPPPENSGAPIAPATAETRG